MRAKPAGGGEVHPEGCRPRTLLPAAQSSRLLVQVSVSPAAHNNQHLWLQGLAQGWTNEVLGTVSEDRMEESLPGQRLAFLNWDQREPGVLRGQTRL